MATDYKLYNANELIQMLTRVENIISHVKKVIVTGEANAIQHAKDGHSPVDANLIGAVAFRDAGQLFLQAMQIMADTQGADLSNLLGGELDDLVASGFRWGNFAMLGSPKEFDHFSAFVIEGDILGGVDAATPFLTFTAISEDIRHDAAAGFPDVDPWTITPGRVVRLIKFPDLEGQEAEWHSTAGNHSFPLITLDSKHLVEEGKIFEVKSKGTWGADLAATSNGQAEDATDLLQDAMLPVLKANERFIRFNFDCTQVGIPTVEAGLLAIDNIINTHAPVSSEYFMIREIATSVAAIHGTV